VNPADDAPGELTHETGEAASSSREPPTREAERRTPPRHEDPAAVSLRPNNRTLRFEEEMFLRAA